MKILLASHFFHPSIGGIERVSLMLAQEFVRLGHDVCVVTQTTEASGVEFPFRVVRRPGVAELWRLVRWCDVCFHNNIVLRMAWPLLLKRRPWVVAHHMWISRADGRLGWQDRLKRRLLRHAANIAVSSSLARDVGLPMPIVGNPYDDRVFRRVVPAREREGELIFVGRLVSDKGVDLLLAALAQLKARGSPPQLTIVGGGPEEAALRTQTKTLGLQAHVSFAGVKTPEELSALLNVHRVMVAPSRRAEPFGLVALEGLACGCVVAGSSEGGLPEAIGPGGVTFPNGEVPALATALTRALALDADEPGFRREVEAHLMRYQPAEVARAYLAVFERALNEKGPLV